MKNIVTLIGTRNLNTRTYKYVEEIFNELNVESEYNNTILNPTKYCLNPCSGCKNCFSNGICIFDNLKDDKGSELKQLLLSADLIIISSPVYAHNVTSDVKLIFDRLSYWLHIFKLLGKPVIILTTTDTNGESFVNDYLTKMFQYMGAVIISNETFFAYDTQEEIFHKLQSIRSIIKDALEGNIVLESSPMQEAMFQQLKYTYLFFPKEHYEYKYWDSHGYFNANSFSELLVKDNSHNE